MCGLERVDLELLVCSSWSPLIFLGVEMATSAAIGTRSSLFQRLDHRFKNDRAKARLTVLLPSATVGSSSSHNNVGNINSLWHRINPSPTGHHFAAAYQNPYVRFKPTRRYRRTTFPVSDAWRSVSPHLTFALGCLRSGPHQMRKIHIEGDFLHGFIQSLAINAGSILL